MSADALLIVYDGHCPFCAAYMRLLRLRADIGPVRLIDARSGDPVVAQVKRLGLDLDAGMAMRLDGIWHHGDACLNRLALLSTPSGLFNRANRLIFASPRLSRLLYPALVLGRRAALALLGRRSIAADDAAMDRKS